MQVLLCPKSHTALGCFNSIDLAMIKKTETLKKLPRSTHRRVVGAQAVVGSHRASFLVPVTLLNKGKKANML